MAGLTLQTLFDRNSGVMNDAIGFADEQSCNRLLFGWYGIPSADRQMKLDCGISGEELAKLIDHDKGPSAGITRMQLRRILLAGHITKCLGWDKRYSFLLKSSGPDKTYKVKANSTERTLSEAELDKILAGSASDAKVGIARFMAGEEFSQAEK